MEFLKLMHATMLLPHLFMADLYTREGQGATALKHHKKALALTNDDELKTRVLYQMGTLYYETNQLSAMKEILPQGLTSKINYPPLNNLLAYYYATKGKDIDQAQKLIELALAKDPENEHFLDTQGVIYYKQQKYDQALAIFEKIAKTNAHDYTIIKNWGKTLLKLGRFEQAKGSIEQALTLAKTPYDKKKCENLLKNCTTSLDEKKST